MDGCIPIHNQVFSGGELVPFARIRRNYMPSIFGVLKCLKLRKRCRIRAQIQCKLLRDNADLPPWFLAISTPMESTMESNSRITNQFGALAVDNPARHLPGPHPWTASLDHIP
jgi:hypothetical protein